ncbi:hypothetical protein QR680_018342 [Steinernema hermaphroditum]|uniref:Uncharacterized protein n=1 Tax=Steinernema hermaphroditum TaxID=289476 RepID=A0AA39LQ68_9BILA|nr:hypothetical protein QR680_018342 [Steinernema hermaphroditum]
MPEVNRLSSTQTSLLCTGLDCRRTSFVSIRTIDQAPPFRSLPILLCFHRSRHTDVPFVAFVILTWIPR